MKNNNTIDQKEFLPVNEEASLTGRNSFRSMRCKSLIDWREFLPVNEV
jgi:hypothetical protein